MALNTPKRLRTTLDSFIGSPSAEQTVQYNSMAGSQHQQQHQHHHQQQSQHQQQQQQLLESPQWSGGLNRTPFQQQQQYHHQQPLSHPCSPLPNNHAPTMASNSNTTHMATVVGTPHSQHQSQQPLQQQQQPQHAHWLAAASTLSPASSCGSPEFLGGNNGRISQLAAATQKFQPSTGTGDNGAISTGLAAATNGSGGGIGGSGGGNNNENSRRGRPRSEAITTLMIEGSTSPSAIKCSYCHRVFPREKSLQAHLRTHTGERPYPCDYPGCTRAFTQSGQLKTHQRLHTGERPFMCSALACQQRFTHANRHCPDHPYGSLRRCDDIINVAASAEQNTDVLRWLEKYRAEKEDRTPSRRTPKRTPKRTSWAKAKALSQSGGGGGTGIETNNAAIGGATGAVAGAVTVGNQENMPHNGNTPIAYTCAYGNANTNANNNASAMQLMQHAHLPASAVYGANNNNHNHTVSSPSTPSNPRKSRKGLMVELDMNAGMGVSPIAAKVKAPQPKQIQWTDMPMSQEEDSADDDDDDDDEDDGDDDDDDDGFETPAAQSTFNPKKRWLREAWQDDLARPLEMAVPPPPPTGSYLQTSSPAQQVAAAVQPPAEQPAYVNPNQMRPSVLMIASKDRTMPLVEHQRQLHAQHAIVEQRHQLDQQLRVEYERPLITVEPQPEQPATMYGNNYISYPNVHAERPAEDWMHHIDAHALATDHQPHEWEPCRQSNAMQSVNSNATTTNTTITNGTAAPNTPNRKWLGAMALMQLATNDEADTAQAVALHQPPSTTMQTGTFHVYGAAAAASVASETSAAVTSTVGPECSQMRGSL